MNSPISFHSLDIRTCNLGYCPVFGVHYIGLSYTTFAYSNFKIEKTADLQYTIAATITNTGKMAGAEIAQLYIAQKKCLIDRPAKELKGFAKTELKAGESKNIAIKIGKEAFEYYHPQKKQWVYDPGEFELLLGTSSQDIKLKRTITL